MPLAELEIEIIKTVVDRFFKLKESTPRKLLVTKFRSPEALYRLSNASILTQHGNTEREQVFLPSAVAFYYAGDPEIIRIARASVETVLHVLQHIYVETENVEFTPSEIEAYARKLYDIVDPDHIKLGLYLIRDFRVLGAWGMNTTQTGLISLRVAENIVTIKDVNKEWDAFIERSTVYDRTPQERSLERPFMTDGSPKAATHSGLSILISHSSKDAELALALIDLLKAGLGLTANKIRCTSVDGYRLPVGVNTEARLREEINAAEIVIGLITSSSLSSYYVMFELGARWGANLFVAPLLAGVQANELSGPLSLLNALSANSEAQLHQLLADIGKTLELSLQPSASYIRNVTAVKAMADALAIRSTSQHVPAPFPKRLRITVTVEGHPPSQVLKVIASQPVAVSRIDYMMTSEATIASEDVSFDGESLEIPVNDSLLLKLWNTPRPDRNHYDHSGPAKLGITVAADGQDSQQLVLPVQMENTILNSTAHRKLVGSKTFYDRA